MKRLIAIIGPSLQIHVLCFWICKYCTDNNTHSGQIFDPLTNIHQFNGTILNQQKNGERARGRKMKIYPVISFWLVSLSTAATWRKTSKEVLCTSCGYAKWFRVFFSAPSSSSSKQVKFNGCVGIVVKITAFRCDIEQWSDEWLIVIISNLRAFSCLL